MDTFNSKVLIFGEYSLLYNSKALTMPLAQFKGKLTMNKTPKDNPYSKSSNASLREFCRHIIKNHFPLDDEGNVINIQRFQVEVDNGLYFESNIPQGFGLGSSGAVVAAIFMRYIDRAGEMKDLVKAETKENISKLKKILSAMETFFHGTSSGIDPLSIILNKPLLYTSATDVMPVDLPKQNPKGKQAIFLLNTEISRNTGKLVQRFKKSCEDKDFRTIMDQQLVAGNNACIEAFLAGNNTELFASLKKVCEFQYNYMDYLVPGEFKDLMSNGLNSGNYYLKICGSGGGGYMLGFTEDWKQTQIELKNHSLESIYRF
jgi:mevalonate kinase